MWLQWDGYSGFLRCLREVEWKNENKERIKIKVNIFIGKASSCQFLIEICVIEVDQLCLRSSRPESNDHEKVAKSWRGRRQ